MSEMTKEEIRAHMSDIEKRLYSAIQKHGQVRLGNIVHEVAAGEQVEIGVIVAAANALATVGLIETVNVKGIPFWRVCE